jgi:hypothetical protein
VPLSDQARENRRRYNRQYDADHPGRRAALNAKNSDRNKKYMNEYSKTIVGRAHRMFNGAKRRANEKDLPFTITTDEIKRALQMGHCERTGIKFVFCNNDSLFAPSIDRIDSALGYTPDNVQYVCCAYNMGKKHMTDIDYETFILMAAQFIKIKYGGR